MNPESNLLRFPNVGTAVAESSEQQRTALKNLAWQHINTITRKQAIILLRNIKVLEDLLLGTDYPEELPKMGRPRGGIVTLDVKAHYGLSKGRLINDFKQVVGGMINIMPLERLQEIQANPGELFSLLAGKPLPEAIEVVPEKSELEKEREKKEREATLTLITKIALEKWSDFQWEKPETILNSIRKDFKKAGLTVKVEFFRPNDQSRVHNKEDYKEDYIVVAENQPEKERGIVVPGYGVTLYVPMTFELFGGSKPGRKVSSGTLISFPEVQRVAVDHWKTTKHGKLKDV